MLLIILITLLIQPITALLQVERIETNGGYTIIQEDQVLITKNFFYSLHVIDLKQIEEVINQILISVSLLPEDIQPTLMEATNILKDRLITLGNGYHSIQKRGLFNFVGTINKWITGTMDEEDRQLINQHFETTDTNNHNIITNMNEQIQINNNFNTSINKLLNTIEEDRKLIQNYIQTETDKNRLKITTFEIRLNIQELEKIITDLQDNIIFSKLNVIHPSLLTHKEIIDYQINANKIRNLKIGFTKSSTNKLIFLIKIPFRMITANKKLIVPLSNENSCKVIKSEITKAIEYKNEFYEYDENKALPQLKILKHCIIKENCKSIKQCKSEMYNIDDSSILLQLAKNITLESDCDERKYTLNGNYFIKFFNCTIKIDNNIFYNKIQEIAHKYIIPHLTYESDNNTLSFEDIVLETTKNLNEIKEIKFHKTIIYSGISTISIILIILIIIILYLYNKNKKIKVSINTNKKNKDIKSNKDYVSQISLDELKKKYNIV